MGKIPSVCPSVYLPLIGPQTRPADPRTALAGLPTYPADPLTPLDGWTGGRTYGWNFSPFYRTPDLCDFRAPMDGPQSPMSCPQTIFASPQTPIAGCMTPPASQGPLLLALRPFKPALRPYSWPSDPSDWSTHSYLAIRPLVCCLILTAGPRPLKQSSGPCPGPDLQIPLSCFETSWVSS